MTLHADSALLCGDLHADYGFLHARVLPSAVEAGVSAVVVLGDFGYWAHARDFLREASRSRENFGVDVWFLDGNHEEHPLLASDAAACREDGADVRDPVRVGESLWWLPRGSRIEVGTLSVAVLGGAVSLDMAFRVEGEDWFAEEEASDEDVAACVAGGPADVLLCHDAPTGWVVPGLLPRDALFPQMRARLVDGALHRIRLRAAYEAVAPRLLVHGHYHRSYRQTVDEPWGAVEVVGLQRNGFNGWGRVLRGDGGRVELGEPLPAFTH